ncbi:MAG: substrate-binding domain-containing protein [Oscillospiraceae bacterium]
MKKIFAGLLVLVLMLGTMMGCSSEQKENAPKNTETEAKNENLSEEEYVFITAASSIEYFNAHKKGLQDACKALGVKATIVGDDKVDAGTMSSLIEATIERGVAGIVLVGHFPDAYATLIDRAWEKGIPVVTQTVDVPDSKRICFIGTDFYSYGMKQMDIMAEAIGGKGKIAISTSMDSGKAAIDSLNGMKDRAIEKYPEIEIVAVLEDKCQTDTAVSVIGACLQANPDLSGILGAQSVSGIAAVTAAREAGILDKIKIIAVDRDIPTLEAIEAGEIYGTICGKQYAEVYYGIKILFDYNHTKLLLSNDDKAAGLIGVPSYVDLGAISITKDNVKYFMGFAYDYER